MSVIRTRPKWLTCSINIFSTSIQRNLPIFVTYFSIFFLSRIFSSPTAYEWNLRSSSLNRRSPFKIRIKIGTQDAVHKELNVIITKFECGLNRKNANRMKVNAKIRENPTFVWKKKSVDIKKKLSKFKLMKIGFAQSIVLQLRIIIFKKVLVWDSNNVYIPNGLLMKPFLSYWPRSINLGIIIFVTTRVFDGNLNTSEPNKSV